MLCIFRPLWAFAFLFFGVGILSAQVPIPVIVSPDSQASPTYPKVDLPPTKLDAAPTPAEKLSQGAVASPTTSITSSPASDSSSPMFDLIWNNGLFIKSKDGNFTSHVGGTLHYDGAWYSGGRAVQTLDGGVGRFIDGVNARRLRFYMEGGFYKDFDYKLEVEFMNGFSPAGLNGPITPASVSNSPGPTDAWVTIKNVPILGNIRIGNQKEWFSLEHLEGYRNLLYMERSYLFDFSQLTAFNNGFTPGISVFNTWLNDRIFTGIGVYKNESDLLGFGLGFGDYAVTGRVAGLPLYEPDCERYWHIGGAMSVRDPVNDTVQVRIRNSVRNAPFPLLNLIGNTGPVRTESQTLFNVETAASNGPFTFSAEYTVNLLNGARVGNGPELGTLGYQGFYVQGMVFLTGEHRGWDPKIGSFKRVTPKNNLSMSGGGWGALEVGLRYTYLDLDDKGVNGGRLNNLTFGSTWYWNPNVRMQLNYDYLYRDGGRNPIAKGEIHSLGVRLAMDY
jgi:phosphate-selective porin OprO and OprP